ncbi:hypothetical protein PPL_04888 [Heterostelium album PN500]|uniref:Uncharacterized protein n=1 Tax=Heterostelium pallidum (strain ATCC 26659 / Pp 5 / PN500) TaxID=670386 RepID=D3B8U5_HETP5|nr:hypothetical protein PPL_04888 [Heterostelium album PN500]EFA82463.1 hypothetical protein PPL_04888 [Heterostelium album PN500]|eukprot:XP_020434580.1 hypothetical protein PPL_04888 [Heterostelium album PN500]
MTILENLQKIGQPLESMTSAAVSSSTGSESVESLTQTAGEDWRGGDNWRGGRGGHWRGRGGHWRGGRGGGHWRGG